MDKDFEDKLIKEYGKEVHVDLMGTLCIDTGFVDFIIKKLHASEQARKELKKKLKGKMMNIKYDIGDCIRHKDFISQWSDTKKRNIPKEIVSDIVRIIEIRVSKHNDGKAIQYITNRGHWLFENDIIELTKAELKQQIK